MAAYRLIAIDLDGTLLSPDGQVTPRTRQAVHKALAAGLLVCFATGRNWTESRTILDAVAHYDTAVFVGGAMVIDVRNGVTLHRTAMRPELAREISGLLESLGHAVLALQDTPTSGIDYLITDAVPLNVATRQWMRVTSAVVHRVPKLGSFAHEHTIRVGIVAEPAETVAIEKLLRDRYGDGIVCHVLYVPTYGVQVLEVLDPAVSKWEGILHVARRHGIRAEQIVAIGDDANDVPMVKNAGLGVAMGNARGEVRLVARRIIGTNQDEGLADFLEELVAKHTVDPLGPLDATDATDATDDNGPPAAE